MMLSHVDREGGAVAAAGDTKNVLFRHLRPEPA
jgi:hypothetical protein